MNELITREKVRELGLSESRGTIRLFGPIDWIDAIMWGAPDDWREWILWTSHDGWDFRQYATEPTFLRWRDGTERTCEWEWLGMTYTITITDGTWKQLRDLVRAAYAQQLREWQGT